MRQQIINIPIHLLLVSISQINKKSILHCQFLNVVTEMT